MILTRERRRRAVMLGAAVVLMTAIVIAGIGSDAPMAASKAPPPQPQFVDNGDATVTDTQTQPM